MNGAEWDGKRRISNVALVVGIEGGGRDAGPVRFVAIAEESGTCTVLPHHLGAFLLVHPDIVMVCCDAAAAFWAAEERLRVGSEWTAWKALWDVAATGRMIDVRVFDQLLRVACDGGDPGPRSQAELASSYRATSGDGGGLPDASEQADLGEVGSEPARQAIRVAEEILRIYRVQDQDATRMLERTEVAPEDVARFGPLGIGLRVRAAIAFGRPDRGGLRVRDGAETEFHKRCHDAMMRGSRDLRDDPAARKCFEWDVDTVARDEAGLPRTRKPALRAWLEQTAGTILGYNGVPFEPLRTDDGAIPALWNDLARAHSGLRAWSEVWAAADALRALDRDGGVIRPRYEVVPRIRAIDPDLDQVRRVAPPGSLAAAEPGHTLLVVRFPDLLLKCHAAVCEREGGASQLGGLFRARVDPTRFVASRLANREQARSGQVELPWFVFEEEVELQGQLEGWIPMARALLDLVPRGLAAPQVRNILGLDHGLDVDPIEAEGLVEFMFSEVLLDLGLPVAADRTFEILAHNLGCSFKEVIDFAPLDEHPATAAAALRNLISGKSASLAAFDRLRAICRNESLRGMLACRQGSPALFDALFAGYARSSGGRLRRGPFFTGAQAGEHLDLADDVIAAAAFAIVSAGHDLVGCAAYELAVQVHADRASAEECIPLATLINRATRAVLSEFPPYCQIRPEVAWK